MAKEHETPSDEMPSDWLARLMAILSSEGVTRIHGLTNRQWLLLNFRVWGELFASTIGVFILFVMLGMTGESVARHFGMGKDSGIAMAVILWFVVVWYWSRRMRRVMRDYSNLRMQRKGERMLTEKNRPPVLYLRSFAFDRFSNDAPVLEKRWGLTITQFGLEELLVQLVGRYATVLAIGKPGEAEPPPGATRFYVEHAEWQKKVSSIVPLSRLVIWATGTTDGLLWEIEHLVRHNGPRRLLLFVHIHAMNTSAERQTLEWKLFLQKCGHVFVKPLPQSVEDIRFIEFDDEWNPVPIPRRNRNLSAREIVFHRPGLAGLEPVLGEKLL